MPGTSVQSLMVRLSYGCGKHDGYCIADDAIKRAMVRECYCNHGVKITVKQGYRLTGIHALHQCSKASQVSEYKTALLATATQFEGVWMVDQMRHQVG